MTQGGVFSTQAKAFLLEDASRVVERSFKATPGSFWDKGWDVISRRPQKFAGWMDTLESHQRVALYLDARLRKGLSAEASSRLVREAYFDWTYPANLFGETAFMGLPVLMFGSMWKNAATHTIQALMDPRKAKRMMDMFKAADIGTDFYSEDTTSMFPMEMDRFAKEMAWWSGKSGQLFVTEGASDEEAQSGVMFQGGPTTTMAWSTPGALNHDLLVLGANTALSTAIMVNDLGHTPRSHENIERYQQNLGMAMATFMNPITAGALGLGSPYKSYDGKMKITPAEYALYNRMGWGDPEYKVNEDYGGGKFRANQGTVRATRLMPGINRIIRDMDPVVRQQMGDPSVDLLHDLVAIEMGAKPYPIMGGAAEHVKRRNILEGKAKDLSR